MQIKEGIFAKIKRTLFLGPILPGIFVLIETLIAVVRIYFIQYPMYLNSTMQVLLTIPFALVFLVGYGAFWATYLKHNVGTSVIKSGPYRLVRHPLYSVDVFTLPVIFAVWMNDFLFLAVWPVLILLTYFVVAKEEVYMETKFGKAYSDYKKRVPRLFPFRGFVKFQYAGRHPLKPDYKIIHSVALKRHSGPKLEQGMTWWYRKLRKLSILQYQVFFEVPYSIKILG